MEVDFNMISFEPVNTFVLFTNSYMLQQNFFIECSGKDWIEIGHCLHVRLVV